MILPSPLPALKREFQQCHYFVVLCLLLQHRHGPPEIKSEGNGGQEERREEDAPCSPGTLLTLCVRCWLIPDTNLVKDLVCHPIATLL